MYTGSSQRESAGGLAVCRNVYKWRRNLCGIFNGGLPCPCWLPELGDVLGEVGSVASLRVATLANAVNGSTVVGKVGKNEGLEF